MISKLSSISETIRHNYPLTKQSISNRKLIYGVGLNDSDYQTQPNINGSQISCPIYTAWKCMLNRVYNENKARHNIVYNDVTVCSEWLVFSNFRKWFFKKHVDDYKLDKDLLIIGNKTYSPNTCIYVPTWLNCFVINCTSSRGKYKVGVYLNKRDKLFVAQCSNPTSKKRERLGSFKNEDDAYNAWLKRKLELALELKPKIDAIDLRIYPNVVEIIKNIK